MGRFVRPDPRLRRVVAVPGRLPGPAVPHLVPGVLRVAQDLPHAGSAPRSESSRRVDAGRWRETAEIRVQRVAELGDADSTRQVHVVDAPDDGGAHGVGLQGPLALAACGLVGVRVVVLDEPVAVGRDAARVPALAGGGLKSLAGLHHQLVVVAAGDPDVHVPEHDRAKRLLERLVGAAQPNPGGAEIVLDPERHRGVARQPRDRLHDHAIEPARSPGCGCQQLLETAVARNGNVEASQAALLPPVWASPAFTSPRTSTPGRRDWRRQTEPWRSHSAPLRRWHSVGTGRGWDDPQPEDASQERWSGGWGEEDSNLRPADYE
jgi:hypothetical protein